MQNDVLQFLSEAVAMEQLLSGQQIKKTAGLFDELGFTTIASSIISEVKASVFPDPSPSGIAKSLGEMLVSGALFKIHWVLGVAYTAANLLGLDLVEEGKKILNSIISSGKTASFASIDVAGKVMLLSFLRTASPNTAILRYGWGRKGASDEARMWQLFKGLAQKGRGSTLKRLIVAIFIYAFKAILIGAGLIGGAHLLSSIFTGNEQQKEPAEEVIEQPAPEQPAKPEYTIPELETRPASRAKQFINDRSHPWIVPLVNGSVEQTVLAWALLPDSGYPDKFSGYEGIIVNLPSFRNVVDKLKNNFNARTPGSLLMPMEFKSRSQVVDKFAPEAMNKIEGQL